MQRVVVVPLRVYAFDNVDFAAGGPLSKICGPEGGPATADTRISHILGEEIWSERKI
jgi:hypothetical protein